MTKSRDETREQLAQAQKQCKVLEKDLAGVKSQLAQEQRAKKQMQRDQQAAMSFANAFQNGSNQSAIDFYKRKVSRAIGCAL